MGECQCGTKLVWVADHTYEDEGMIDDGMVQTCACPNEDCAVENVVYYLTNEKSHGLRD
jgi:hypothetical protein